MDELEGLTYAEEALIARIQPIVAAKMLKGGARSMTGMACFVDRLSAMSELATELPRLAKDVEYIVVERRAADGGGGTDADDGLRHATYKELRVRRSKVQRALDWLCKHSDAYACVTISTANMEALPDDGPIETQVRELDDDEEEDRHADEGPAAAQQTGPEPAEDDVAWTESGAAADAQFVGGAAAQLRADLGKMAGIVPDDTPPDEPVFRQEYAEYVRWDETPYFFASAWPTLFLPTYRAADGEVARYHMDCDLMGAELVASTVTIAEYVKHLMTAANFRYSRHASFKFCAKSMKDARATVGQTSFGVQQMPDACQLTKADMVDMLREPCEAAATAGDGAGGRVGSSRQAGGGWAKPPGLKKLATIAQQVSSFSKNVTGSAPYWWQQKSRLDAMVTAKLQDANELPCVFFTGSMAEVHWPELHRVLHRCLDGVHQEEAAAVRPIAEGREPDPGTFMTLQRCINAMLAPVNELFEARTTSWFKHVIVAGLGITDYYYRYEFAKSRGAAHWHALGWAPDAVGDLHASLDEVTSAVYNGPVTKDGLHAMEMRAANSMCAAARESFGCTWSAEHPGGRERKPGAEFAGNAERARGESRWFRRRTADLATGETVYKNCGTNDDAKGGDWAKDERGNIDQWPLPEGLPFPPVAVTRRTLRTQVVQLADAARRTGDAAGAKRDDMVDHTNCVGLHGCSGYCLKPSQPPRYRKPDKEDGLEPAAEPGTPAPTGGPAPTGRGARIYCCRGNFGDESLFAQNSKTRTEGRQCHRCAMLETEGGVTRLHPPRNHPRMVAGPLAVGRAYRANCDMQLLVAAQKDLPPAVRAWTMQNYDYERGVEGIDGHVESLRMFDIARQYGSRRDVATSVCRYITAYACKGEVSAAGASKLFLDLVQSESLCESTTLYSMAQRLQSKLCQARQISSSEAIWGNLGMPMSHASKPAQYVPYPGRRTLVNAKDGGDDDAEAVAVHDNLFDKYVKDVAAAQKQQGYKTKRNKEASKGLDEVSFNMYATALKADRGNSAYWAHSRSKEPGQVAVYYGYKMDATWPLTEDYAASMLVLHRRGLQSHADIYKSFEGANGDNYINSVEAFEAFLGKDTGKDTCPDHVKDAVRHAKIRHTILDEEEPDAERRAARDRKRKQGLRGHGDGRSGSAACADSPWASSEEEDDGADDAFSGGSGGAPQTPEYSERTAGTDISPGWRCLYPAFMKEWTANTTKEFYRAMDAGEPLVPKDATGKYQSVAGVDRFAQQRFLITEYIDHLRQVTMYNDDPTAYCRGGGHTKPQFRAVVVGLAGAGKTYVMSLIALLSRLITGQRSGVMVTGPTGSAALNGGGSTPERAVSMGNRGNQRLTNLTATAAAALQQKYQHTICSLNDEVQ